jgi:hypothetical protein
MLPYLKETRYMEHPNGKVARASHSVFTAFISMGKESEKIDRVSLKEKLVFHYIQVSLSVIILPNTLVFNM